MKQRAKIQLELDFTEDRLAKGGTDIGSGANPTDETSTGANRDEAQINFLDYINGAIENGRRNRARIERLRRHGSGARDDVGLGEIGKQRVTLRRYTALADQLLRSLASDLLATRLDPVSHASGNALVIDELPAKTTIAERLERSGGRSRQTFRVLRNGNAGRLGDIGHCSGPSCFDKIDGFLAARHFQAGGSTTRAQADRPELVIRQARDLGAQFIACAADAVGRCVVVLRSKGVLRHREADAALKRPGAECGMWIGLAPGGRGDKPPGAFAHAQRGR